MSDPPPNEKPNDKPLYLAGDIVAQKYRLTRLLGEGGMGAVWLARNVKLDADVAIKLIRHELATDETAHRLLQEARAAARIGHRSIVRIFDFGETELDDPFIVMEVLTGESLRVVLERKGRLPAANAVRTLLPIASALVEAHASGIVHRDLKPENVVLVPDKRGGVVPKLLDFGIAKFCRANDGADDVASPGFAVGTPDYMSPEQAGGRDEVDERADVWALAVMLYEAITGAVPFKGRSYPALVFAIMTEEPTPIGEQMAGDATLWTLLQEGLAKVSTARPTMRAFGVALAEWALARGIDSDVTGTSLRAHWLHETSRSPFSMAPPSSAPSSVGGVPSGVHVAMPRDSPTLAPPRPPDSSSPVVGAVPRRRSAAWVAGASVLAGAALVMATRGRASPPAPSSSTVQAASSMVQAAALPSEPADSGSAAPLAAASGLLDAPTDVPTAAPAPTASAKAIWTARPGSRPPGRLPIRKGSLPIAKHPNF